MNPQHNNASHVSSSVANIDDGRWTILNETSENVAQLKALCHSPSTLQQQGYVTAQLSSEQLLRKLRCEKCANPVTSPVMVSDTIVENGNWSGKIPCSYHTQGVVRGAFACCGTRLFTRGDRGCYQAPSHQLPHQYEQHLQNFWRYYRAVPESVLISQNQLTSLVSTRPRENNGYKSVKASNIRTAVALDCEYGSNKYNHNELIRLSVVDFFSGQVLINSLVNPAISMKHYNTRYSGVSRADMDRARREGKCFHGRDAARAELLRFVGPDTVIVAHSGSGDLTSLRLIHPHIIDSFVVDDWLEPVRGGRSLKNLCAVRLGVQVQVGKRGHDSVEDALGARELVLLHIKGSKRAAMTPGINRRG